MRIREGYHQIRKIPSEDLPLTKWQKTILRTFENGCTYAEAAEILAISRMTVNRHLVKIYEKLRARNKVNAIAIAIRRGLI